MKKKFSEDFRQNIYRYSALICVLVLIGGFVGWANSLESAPAKWSVGVLRAITIVAPDVTITADSVAELRTLDRGNLIHSVKVLGYYTAGDGGGGPVRIWQDGATAGTYADNGGSIIVPTGGDGSAAWVFSKSDDNVKAWGAKDDGTTDNSTFIQNDLTTNNSATVPYSTGSYRINSTVTVGANQSLIGINHPTLLAAPGIIAVWMDGNNSVFKHFHVVCNSTQGNFSNTGSIGLRMSSQTSVAANPLADWTTISNGIVSDVTFDKFYTSMGMDVTYEWKLSHIQTTHDFYGFRVNQRKFATYGAGGGRVVNNLSLDDVQCLGTVTAYPIQAGMTGWQFYDVFQLNARFINIARYAQDGQFLNVSTGNIQTLYMEGGQTGATSGFSFNGCYLTVSDPWVDDESQVMDYAFQVHNGRVTVAGGMVKLSKATAYAVKTGRGAQVDFGPAPFLSDPAGTWANYQAGTGLIDHVLNAIHPLGSGLNVGNSSIYSNSVGFSFGLNSARIYPSNSSGATIDGTVDLGSPTIRFDKAYIKNGVIVTTPDGTKKYLIGVDNSGAITATLQ